MPTVLPSEAATCVQRWVRGYAVRCAVYDQIAAAKVIERSVVEWNERRSGATPWRGFSGSRAGGGGGDTEEDKEEDADRSHTLRAALHTLQLLSLIHI